MDPENPVIKLCIAGTQAEFAGRMGEARALYWQAWEQSRGDFEACIAAHYVARCQESLQARLEWNLEALRLADASSCENIRGFYLSLYVNLGRAYELLGSLDEAALYYQKAAALGLVHQAHDEYLDRLHGE